MTINTPYSAPLRDILYAFSLAQPIPNATLLDEFARRYPEHAAALTEFAVNLVLDAAWHDRDESAESITPHQVSPAVSRAMSRFQNRLFHAKQSAAQINHPKPIQSSPADNPFARLSRKEFRQLAERLDVNVLFLTRLRDREIDPDTMSQGFKEHVAHEVHAPLDLVVAHFAAESEVNSRQLYKADDKPRLQKKRSFRDVVLDSGLNKQQQQRLLSI